MDTFDFKMAQARAMMALDSSSGPARAIESNMNQVRHAEAACRRAMCRPPPPDCAKEYVIGEKHSASVVETAMLLSQCERGSMDGPQIDTQRAALDWLCWRVMDGWDDPSEEFFSQRARNDVDRAVRALAMCAAEVARPWIEKSEFDSGWRSLRQARECSIVGSLDPTDRPRRVGLVLLDAMRNNSLSEAQLALRLGVPELFVATELLSATDFTGMTCESLGKVLESPSYWIEASSRYRDFIDTKREGIERAVRRAESYRSLIRETYQSFYKGLISGLCSTHTFGAGTSEAQIVGDWLSLPMGSGEQFMDWLEGRGMKKRSNGSEEERDAWLSFALKCVVGYTFGDTAERTGFCPGLTHDPRAAEAYWTVLGLFDVRLAVDAGLRYLEDRGWFDRESLKRFMVWYRKGEEEGLSNELVAYSGNLATFALDELIRSLEGGAKAFFSVRGICRRQAYAQRLVGMYDGKLDPQQQLVLRLLQISTLPLEGSSFVELFEGVIGALHSKPDHVDYSPDWKFGSNDGELFKRNTGRAIAWAGEWLVGRDPAT